MAKQWYHENLRFLQTVLREIDIIDYDPKTVVKYMKDVNANCLVVNAGGVIDFFDNPLDMANPNRFMKTEILHGICEEIHKAGMRVITRVDFRGVEPRRYNLHPDWFSVDQDGKPRTSDLGSTKITRPCYHSPYANEHAEGFIDYLMSHYDIDGIWQNALAFDSGPCYCKNCRDAYLRDTGKDIPRIPAGMDVISALESPAFEEYRAWKVKHADRHIERMRAAVKKYGENKAYCAEIFDIYNDRVSKATGIDHSNAKKSFDFIVSCVFINSGHSQEQRHVYDLIHNAGSTIRFSRALDPKKQPVIVTGGNGTKWRYTADPLLEDRTWQWEMASVGGGIWNCYFNGSCPATTVDRRAAYNEKDIFTYLADNSASISDTVPAMDAAIYFSNCTKDKLCHPDERKDQYGVYIKGAERVLLENHIQYGFIPDSELSLERLNGVKVLLVPNAMYMSDRDIGIIRQYVKNGGGLVASHSTSLFDEKGARRADFGLAELFGVSFTGRVMDSYNDTYQLIADKSSAVLAGVGDTDVLINGGTTVLCAAANPSYNKVATHIPTIHNQPPEYGWIPDMKTVYPTIVTGRYGKGTVVYFANGIEAQSYLNGHEDYTEIYKNAVDFASGGAYTLTAAAPRSVHVNAIVDQHDSGHLIVSLINATGTSLRPLKEVVPVYGAKVRVPLGGRNLKESRVLWGGKEVTVAAEGGAALIEVGMLNEFASVELKLG